MLLVGTSAAIAVAVRMPPSSWREWLAMTARLIVGVTFVVAGANKLDAPEQFSQTLRRFPLSETLFATPRRARIGALIVACLELTLGIALLAGLWTAASALTALLVLGVFTAGLTAAVVSKRKTPCGCLKQTSRPVGWTDVVRNVVLLAFTVAAVPDRPLSSIEAPAGALASGVSAGLLAVAISVWVLLGRRRSWPVLATAGGDPPRTGRGDGVSEGGRAFFAAAEGSGGDGPNDRPTDSARERWPAMAGVAQRERMAASAVGDLHRRVAPIAQDVILRGEITSAEEAEAWLRDEAQLKDLDDALNEGVEELYQSVTGGRDTEQISRLTEIAVLHWTMVLRRKGMRGYHTVVPGLVDDPDCRGDLVGDSLLLDYFETLFVDDDTERKATDAVRALAAIARQTACLGQAQSAHFASDLYWSFVEVRDFLQQNGLGHAVPYVAQAALQPMLLAYDVEKYRGPQSPLARWFSDNTEALLEGATTGRLPAHWHGLWLYDRRTGYLLGYQASTAPKTENDVSLEMFLRSITTRQNLGRYECSFAEMIERGPSRLGYLCGGMNCGEDPLETTALTEGHRRWWQWKANRSGLSSHLGASVGCAEPSGGEGSDGSRGGKCGGGLSAGGRDRIAASVACITERLISPLDRQFSCVAEALGMCAGPIEKATKKLQEGLFQGVKPGRFCQVADKFSTPFSGKTEEERRKNMEFAEKNVEAALKIYGEALDRYNRAVNESEQAYKQYQTNPNPQTRDAYNRASIRADTRLRELEEAEERLKNRQESLEKLRQQQNEEPPIGGDEPGTGVARCPPDTPDCGGNGCSAMAAQALATLKCFQLTGTSGRPDVVRPWGNNPGVVDPSPLDDPEHPSWANCLGTMNEVDPVARKCWAVDCGPGTEAIVSQAGTCGCQPVGLGGPGEVLNTMCASLRCPEDTQPSLDKNCTCQPIFGFDAIGSGGPIPLGPRQLGLAPIFREARTYDLPESLWPKRP
jgi:uncharacterized membrane protein YphA (DoxX/SURF4 family)